MNMRDIKAKRVEQLTPEQCRSLLSHHHGIAYNPMRRKAYMLKASGDNWSAYFKQDEVLHIKQWIAFENVPTIDGAGFPHYSSQADKPIVTSRYRNEDGTYWAACGDAEFTCFGAKECFHPGKDEIGMEGRMSSTAMILLDDGWHYAHMSGSSAYADDEAFNAPNGRIAWLYFTQTLMVRNVKQAEDELKRVIEFKGQVDNALAQAVMEATKS